MTTVNLTTGALEGKVALITGSSQGLGAAIAQELSQRGASIVLNYPFHKLEADCNKVGNSLARPWISVCADLSTLDGPEKLVSAAVERFSRIDILVLNAAIITHGTTQTITTEQWDACYALNVRGSFLMMKAALPHLTPFTPAAASAPPMIGTEGGARVICMSSGTCRMAEEETLLYSSTKGALETMIKIWARELSPQYGCTVNGVSPGPIFTEAFRNTPGFDALMAHEYYGKRTPAQGSLGDPRDIALTVAFLADPTTKWINGEIIMVNGGLTMV